MKAVERVNREEMREGKERENHERGMKGENRRGTDGGIKKGDEGTENRKGRVAGR